MNFFPISSPIFLSIKQDEAEHDYELFIKKGGVCGRHHHTPNVKTNSSNFPPTLLFSFSEELVFVQLGDIVEASFNEFFNFLWRLRNLTDKLVIVSSSSKDFATYWKEYASIKEWETVSEYHLTLEVAMPKDLAESKT